MAEQSGSVLTRDRTPSSRKPALDAAAHHGNRRGKDGAPAASGGQRPRSACHIQIGPPSQRVLGARNVGSSRLSVRHWNLLSYARL
ncbi:hypothetical protein J2T22_002453 [Pseudarthrobacter defluvii]|uniref:Uncharacterized protein n=1 Tax=Pseudarthrobacter defluvii TaxID=410837 RepID=A0ABT9UJW7_9MICC|nr:hypothetical protein [Pseudarthrobacter defluvii]